MKVKMRIAVISDVHSNLIALEAVLADAKTQEVDQYWSLGDQIGYNPWPMECLEMVLKTCSIVLKGNHEDCVCNPYSQFQMNGYAGEGVIYSRKLMSESIRDGVNKFPLVKELPEFGIVLCHGTFTNPEEFKYIDDPYKAKSEIKYTPQRICLVGHTHVPFVYGSQRGLYKTIKDNMELNNAEKFIINVGSVGQPRDGDCRAAYSIFDFNNDKVVFTLRRVFYDIDKVKEKIIEVGLPIELAERLYSGE